LNWADFFQPVTELDQTAIHPALSPCFGQFIWQEKTARNSGGFHSTTWQTRRGLVWLIFPMAYSFLMISPNLHAIWVFFLLNLSQELRSFFCCILGPWAMAIH
jgi:hypothetical protein